MQVMLLLTGGKAWIQVKEWTIEPHTSIAALLKQDFIIKVK